MTRRKHKADALFSMRLMSFLSVFATCIICKLVFGVRYKLSHRILFNYKSSHCSYHIYHPLQTTVFNRVVHG